MRCESIFDKLQLVNGKFLYTYLYENLIMYKVGF